MESTRVPLQMKNFFQFSSWCGTFSFNYGESPSFVNHSHAMFVQHDHLSHLVTYLPIGEQFVSSRTNVTKIREMHKKRMVRAAGAENSSSPVALPRAFLLKLGKNVADAVKK